MFALCLYLCYNESYYIMLYKVYMVRDMFYNNLCHISFFGPLNLGMTTCA